MFLLTQVLILIFSVINLVLSAKYIDLSYPINNDTMYEEGETRYERLVDVEQYTEPDGIWFATYSMRISEQTGTHVDAPYHVFQSGLKLDQIPNENFIAAPAIKIDVAAKVLATTGNAGKMDYNYAVTKKDLVDWEKQYGIIPQRSIVFIHTGWDDKWGNEQEYLGLSAPTRSGKMNFPGLDSSGAKFLSSERNVIGVGIDTISIDPGYSKILPAHSIFASRGIYMIENVANLHLVPDTNFVVWVMPMKIDEASGAPARIVACVP